MNETECSSIRVYIKTFIENKGMEKKTFSYDINLIFVVQFFIVHIACIYTSLTLINLAHILFNLYLLLTKSTV